MEKLQVLDISPDGTATKAALDDPMPADGYRWVSGSPADKRIAAWMASNLSSVARQALLQPETRPRTLAMGAGCLVNLRGVNLNPEQQVDDMVSVRSWIAPGLAVTLRHRPVFALSALREAALSGAAPATPELLLVRLAEELVDRIETVTLDLDDNVDLLEERVFDGDQHTTPDIADLAQLRRSAIRLRRYVGPDAQALLDAGSVISQDPAIRAPLLETANRATRSVEELDAARDRLTALTDHIYLEHAARQQSNGYLLSIVAAIFLPLGFLTGLFGVNVAGMPGVDWPAAFWALAGLSVVIAVLLAVILRWLRWF